ncbi:MAG: ATP-grasp domain-containing protein [Verrucomicrobia bacterium]|nr:ATP-grasp domain-containing protein [Verrucomicrobiota bacterium]
MIPEPVSGKTVLILGAGIYQVPLIRQARAMGLRVLVASRPGPYPGFELADQPFYVDTTDADAVLDIAQREKIAGICTTGTDVALTALGRVADELHLPGPSAAAASIATNKWLMRQAGRQAGVRMPDFRGVRNSAEARRALKELGLPVMVKAVDSSGSRGIVKVTRPEDLDAAIEKVLAVNRYERFLVEQFIEGMDCGAEAFVHRGRLAFLLPTGCMVFRGDATVPIGHYLPFPEGLTLLADVREQVERCVRAAGLDSCAMNFDFILSDGRIHVIEFGARAGATGLPELVSLHCGTNYYEQILRAALGLEPRFGPATGPSCAVHLLLSDRDGPLVEWRDLNPPDAHTVDISFDCRPGEPVRRFRVGPDRIGQIIVKGNALSKVLADLETKKKNIRIVVADETGPAA